MDDDLLWWCNGFLGRQDWCVRGQKGLERAGKGGRTVNVLLRALLFLTFGRDGPESRATTHAVHIVREVAAGGFEGRWCADFLAVRWVSTLPLQQA